MWQDLFLFSLWGAFFSAAGLLYCFYMKNIEHISEFDKKFLKFFTNATGAVFFLSLLAFVLSYLLEIKNLSLSAPT